MTVFRRSFHITLSINKDAKVTSEVVNSILKNGIKLTSADLKYADDNYPLTRVPVKPNHSNHKSTINKAKSIKFDNSRRIRKFGRGLPQAILDMEAEKKLEKNLERKPWNIKVSSANAANSQKSDEPLNNISNSHSDNPKRNKQHNFLKRGHKPNSHKIGSKENSSPERIRYNQRKVKRPRREQQINNSKDEFSILPGNEISYHKGSIKNLGVLEQVKVPDTENLPRLAHELSGMLQTQGIQYHKMTKDQELTHLKIDMLDDFNHFADSFVPPSKDKKLFELTKDEGKTYFSSTSSMTSTLFTFYKLINQYRPNFPERFGFKFTKLMSGLPTSFILSKKNDQVYSIESDKSADKENFLSQFGHISEALLTNELNEIEDFKKISAIERDDNKSNIVIDNQDPEVLQRYKKFINPDNIYNMAKFDKFLMRSQLDCYDESLPGNGTFDLKSRAIGEIRYDVFNPDIKTTEYSNDFQHLTEFDDLIRTGGLLKYSFQARIGQMDGIFISYHNLKYYLGFEYLKINDIDKVYFNNSPIASVIADTQFKTTLRIWGELLDIIRKDMISDNYRVMLSYNQKFNNIQVFVIPLTNEEVDDLQNIAFKSNGDAIKHKTLLEEFNNNSIEKSSKVLFYEVKIKSLLNGELLRDGQLPNDINDNYTFQYSISRRNPNIESYKYLLDRFVSTIALRIDNRDTANEPEFDSEVANNKK